MCSWNADPGGWTAPLPDLSRPTVKRTVRIGSRVFQVAISGVQREVPGKSETHLVQLGVFYGGQPLTAYGLGLCSPDACANAWAYLTNRLTETVVRRPASRAAKKCRSPLSRNGRMPALTDRNRWAGLFRSGVPSSSDASGIAPPPCAAILRGDQGSIPGRPTSLCPSALG